RSRQSESEKSPHSGGSSLALSTSCTMESIRPRPAGRGLFVSTRSSGSSEEHPMTTQRPIAGVWIPLITPYRDGALDERSIRRLARHYAAQPIDGFILAATTGEALTLTEEETMRLIALVAEEVSGKLPIILGRCGSDTRRMAAALERTAGLPI